MSINRVAKQIVVTDVSGDSMMDEIAEGGFAVYRENNGGLTVKAFDGDGSQYIHAMFAEGEWASVIVTDLDDEE